MGGCACKLPKVCEWKRERRERERGGGREREIEGGVGVKVAYACHFYFQRNSLEPVQSGKQGSEFICLSQSRLKRGKNFDKNRNRFGPFHDGRESSCWRRSIYTTSFSSFGSSRNFLQNEKDSFSLSECMRPWAVWPDWAIFERFCQQIFLQKQLKYLVNWAILRKNFLS